MPEIKVEEVDEELPKVNIMCGMISFESNRAENPYGENSIAEGKIFEGLKRFMAGGIKTIALKDMKKKKRVLRDELEEEEEEKKKKKKKKKVSSVQVEAVETTKKVTAKKKAASDKAEAAKVPKTRKRVSNKSKQSTLDDER